MLLKPSKDGKRFELHSPRALPQASGFLWNRHMLLQVNCRGFAVAQHMQPEPAKYAHAPNLEAQTFMQPEQPLYAHHPGRFVYLRDPATGTIASLPHEPVRHEAERFCFSVGAGDIRWQLQQSGLNCSLSVRLPVDDVVELWDLELFNDSEQPRTIEAFPCFSIGYMSWMNQSAAYHADLGGIVARSVTPYQQLEDWERVKQAKDLTFLLHDTPPLAWETSRDVFEGEGGIQSPDALQSPQLGGGDALYETPVAVLQYRLDLAPGERRSLRFLFGPARDETAIRRLGEKFLGDGGFERAEAVYQDYLDNGRSCLDIQTPDADLDRFVNHWLGRQVWYHGDTNRLTTDPQTRNLLQDAMGMVFIEPGRTRETLLAALSQQKADGSMPEGILLNGGSQLKYINTVPHTDHCVWLPVCLIPYLDETGDHALLDQAVSTPDGTLCVFDRVTQALRWLVSNRDERGLSLIDQGDWCDPMNMVGPEGRGVSGWLSMATVHALNLWETVARSREGAGAVADECRAAADHLTRSIQAHLWDGEWFARGITDQGQAFGVSNDPEGRIYLNAQSWALLAGVAEPDQRDPMLAAIDQQLETPFGPMMLAPAYTAMREDIGRITQKHPGSGENGSVYNHAAAFCIHALFSVGEAERGFSQLRRMLPGPNEDDYRQRGQLPVFIPNYYRGAAHQFPRTAGRSSQLFNTGTAAWLLRILTEDLFGLKGSPQGLHIQPQLPAAWPEAAVTRRFRGATVHVRMRRDHGVSATTVHVDGAPLDPPVLPTEPGQTYTVDVLLPGESS